MPLHEFHPFCDAEIARLPRTPGVYLLFQLQIPLHVDSASNLRQGLREARSEYPRATHFSVELLLPDADLPHRVQTLRQELRLVRTATLVGPWQKPSSR